MAPDAIAPDGSAIYFLVPPSGDRIPPDGDRRNGISRASLVEVRLRGGCTSAPVRHRTVEEIWYFLAGTGRVWRRQPDGSVSVTPVGSGAVVTIPTGCAFQFEAEESLRFLCYTSPPWPGEDEAEPAPPLV